MKPHSSRNVQNTDIRINLYVYVRFFSVYMCMCVFSSVCVCFCVCVSVCVSVCVNV